LIYLPGFEAVGQGAAKIKPGGPCLEVLRKSFTAKSFDDDCFELSAHLVVAKLVKKKDAILVNLPREKQDLVPGT
jgi:hypothetical protein